MILLRRSKFDYREGTERLSARRGLSRVAHARALSHHVRAHGRIDATAIAADGRISLGGPAPHVHRAELSEDGRNALAAWKKLA